MSNMFQSVMNKVNTILTQPQSKFRQIFNPQQRWAKHLQIANQNPQYVTVIVEKTPSSKLKMNKIYLQFAINKNAMVNQLRENIRKVLEIHHTQSITLFCQGIVPMATDRIKNLIKYQKPDGWIYFYISQHQSFGGIKQNNEQ